MTTPSAEAAPTPRWLSRSLTAVCLVAIGLAAIGSPTLAADELPLGLRKVKHPKNNLSTPAKIALGKQLFFEPRLSRDNDISCASCHDPKKGFSNGERFATGFKGKKGGRSAPTVINTAYNRFQFWDGRSGSLEDQALGPIQNPIEMNLTLEEAVERLNKIAGYRKQFQAVFGTAATSDGIGKAIAAYERTVLSGDAPIDHFKAGDKKALSAGAERGRKLFFGKANCSACHSGSKFTDNGFHNIGIGMDVKQPDVGREAISNLKGDRGAFKTPTLREVAHTAPYMHDGSLKTLEDVVEHYNGGGLANPFLDEELFKLGLSKEEKADLVTFLKAGLASKNYPMHEAPTLPK